MEIEKFQPKHAKTVSHLVKRVLYEINSEDYDREQLDWMADEYTESRILERAKNEEFFLGFKNDRLVGVISLKKNQLDALFVHPSYQTKGVGKKLVKTIEQFASARNIITLEVRSTVTALPFFLHLGYHEKEKTQTEEGKFVRLEKVLITA